MEITSNFDQVSFHDSTIESVERATGIIIIHFDFAIIAADHPHSRDGLIKLSKVLLTLHGVTSERALIWHDDKTPLDHPNPVSPISEVMHGTMKDSVFHFDGFWKPDDWSEWYISSTRFTLVGVPLSPTDNAF